MNITPRTNTELFGHEEAEQRWLESTASGRLAHGWILSGGRGIGKATLAYRFARHLLNAPGHRIATGAHADLLVVEPAFDEKKGEAASSISVEQAREVAKFLSLTPAESAWRVVIIDSIDQMGVSAANAILKILEEPPPQAVLLLISHNPAMLLPTIRSRCAMLKLKPLSAEDFRRAMRHLHPDMDGETLAVLEMLSGGSPGLAAQYEGEGAAELYGQMLDIASLPSPDPLKIHAFAEQFGGGAHGRFRLFCDLSLLLISRACKGEEPTLSRLHAPGVWAARWQQVAEQFSLAKSRHLDYKQVVILFFHSLTTEEAFSLGTAA